MALVQHLFANTETTTPLGVEERAALRDAFRARALTSSWCGYAVPKHADDAALAFLFTEGGSGGPFKLIRTQAGGYGLASEAGRIVWTGDLIADLPAAFI